MSSRSMFSRSMFTMGFPNPLENESNSIRRFEGSNIPPLIESDNDGNKPSGEWGISDQYIVLDSFEKLENSNTKKGELKFNLTTGRTTGNQKIGVSSDLFKIIEVQIGEFYLPTIPKLPYVTNHAEDSFNIPITVPNLNMPRLSINNAIPQENTSLVGSSQSMACFGGRMSVEFSETKDQSIFGINNNRFHFELQAEPSNYLNNVKIYPIPDWNIFYFTKPINNLDSLTVNIRSPDTGIFLPPDVLYNVEVFISQNGSGQPVIAFSVSKQNHDIVVNDRVFIRSIDLTNGENDPLFSRYDEWLNDESGHLVGIDGTTSTSADHIMDTSIYPTIIRLNPDPNLYDIVQSNPSRYYIGKVLKSATRVNLAIAKNRIRIPLRFRKVLSEVTNFKDA